MLLDPPQKYIRSFLLLACALLAAVSHGQTTTLVRYGEDGRLIYTPNARGDVVPDFSGVGYRNSEADIPDVPVVMTVSPVAGDDRANIQNAINAVAALPLQPNGFRGAILFLAGDYEIGSSVTCPPAASSCVEPVLAQAAPTSSPPPPRSMI
jgi:hypothetical protein